MLPGVGSNRAHAVRDGGQLHERVALFIAAYRQSRGDPSATQAAVLDAFPGATGGDYAIGLMLANRAERGLA